MKRRLGKLSVILSAVIFATAAMSACKKDDISEIDRTLNIPGQRRRQPVSTRRMNRRILQPKGSPL